MDLSICITYADAIERLLVYGGNAAPDKGLSKFRMAIEDAYRDLVSTYPWRYLMAQLRVQLEGPYATGTVTYVASTRVLTLSGGTFPSWAGKARLRIGDLVYRAEELLSGTTLKLSALQAPAVDITDPTTYTLYRSVYELPTDFRGVWQFHGENRWGSDVLAPDDWLGYERNANWQSTSPGLFTIMQSTELFAYGRWGLFVSGYPDVDETFDAIYLRMPRPIKYSGVETAAKGSSGATISNTGAAVTGTGTAFSSDMVGSLLRFTSTVGQNPTSRFGQNPFTEQVAIKSVTDATHLTLESAPSANYSGKQFVITDPLDLTQTMHSAFYAAVQAFLDQNTPDAKRAALSWGSYMRAKKLAKEADSQIYLNPEAGIDSFIVEVRRPLGPDQI